MEIKFYPYDFEYKVKEEKTYVYIYAKLDTSKKVCVIYPYVPYFYADIKNIDTKELKERLNKLDLNVYGKKIKVLYWEEVEKELLGEKKKFWKISVNFPQSVPVLSKELESWGVETFEKDIPFIHRFLRDHQISPLTLLRAKGEQVDDKTMRVPVFLATEIKTFSKEITNKLKYLAVDIETYSKTRSINLHKNPILMIAFYGEDEEGKVFKKVITWKKINHDLKYLEIVSDESVLIERFREIIFDYDPDIITGYFSDGFDFPYLKIRGDKFKIKLDIGLDRSEMFTGRKTGLKNSESKIKGILHLDMFKFVRYIFGGNLKTDSYSLDSVSNELLGLRKHDVDISKLYLHWDKNNSKELEEYCKYNLQDAEITLQLCKKLFFDMVEFSKIISLPLFDVTRMRFSRLVENYILNRSKEYNVIAPNRPKNNEIEKRYEETYQGAFVYEPTPGLYDDILVFDFRSLYPTIITAHNIGPESLYCKCCEEDKSARVEEREEYWFCKKNKKFIPEVLERIVLMRIDLKRLIKELKSKKADEKEIKILESRSYALKILANSFYGYLGFFGARWYCVECARSTAAYARYYIKRTIKKAEEKGFKVIYGDTDSLFLLKGDKDISQAKEFMNEINFDLPGYMELEFEGHFPRGIFVAIKGTNKGAKKKYAMINGQGDITIKGFETVRRNWSFIAKEVQEKVLGLVLSGKEDEALPYLKDVIDKLNKGKISVDKLIIKTQITKDLSSYTSIGPHVAVAKKMKEMGDDIGPGTIIEYVISKGSGLIRDKAKLPDEIKDGEYDPNYYLKNQLIPAVASIFLVMGIKEEDFFKANEQTSLGKFG
ncbi:hypothetical protein HN385_04200 [archaeon]|jgi:DNA polymerase, archaea type|nr:hypothetical protein [archaeon]MBT3450445.1 hypothetical protein [archaeon]MBT6868998.1 hypothetical protein [archaeon]MBT7193264.1 hypothetical protein [archaeon]MBT7380119.1 hypothetical protein [archaeon]